MLLKPFFLQISILLSLIIVSCDHSKLDISDDATVINIENSSGDDFWRDTPEGREYFAPYPFNKGHIILDGKKHEAVLLSQKVETGSKHAINGLAKFTLKSSEGAEKQVFVTLPIENDIKLFETEDFQSFVIEQFAIKQILELWYSNNRGLNGTIVENWQPATLGAVSSL